jgi:hypothetical protein
MPHRIKLQPHVEVVKSAGLQGHSMQDALVKVASEHDLTPHEIRRIAEDANRSVHVTLTKQAHSQKKDARLKFELADPEKVIGEVRKTAAAHLVSGTHTQTSKVAAIEEADGDPFAAPLQPTTKLSLYDTALDEDAAFAREEAQTRGLLIQLDKQHADLQALLNEAKMACISSLTEAGDAHKKGIQAAMDMVQTGITLPSLYRAIMATVSGERAGEGAEEEARKVLRLIVEGLKERGVPNHRLGFRYAANKNEIDGLSTEDIISMCENAVSYDRGELTKAAQLYIEKQPDYATMKSTDLHPYEDAAAWMENRPSQSDHKLPQTYLDERNTGNMPGGHARVFDGDSEFIVSVKDLMGARDRVLKLHSAQEYLGLKMQEIAEAVKHLKTAQHIAAEQFDRKKQAVAFLAPLAGLAGTAARAIAPSLLGAAASGVAGAVTKPKQPAAPATPAHV